MSEGVLPSMDARLLLLNLRHQRDHWNPIVSVRFCTVRPDTFGDHVDEEELGPFPLWSIGGVLLLIIALIAGVLIGANWVDGGDDVAAVATTTNPDLSTTSLLSTTTTQQQTNTTQEPTTTRAPTTTRQTTTTTMAAGAHDALSLSSFSGYSTGSNTWEGVVVIENSSGRMILMRGEIIFRSASGDIIETSPFFQRVAYPFVNYLNVYLLSPAAEPVSADLRVDDAEFYAAGNFVVTDVSTTKNRWGVEVAGEVHSQFAEDVETTELLVVFFASDGSPIFSNRTFLGLVEAGGTTLFKETVFLDSRAPVWDYIEVYAHWWGF